MAKLRRSTPLPKLLNERTERCERLASERPRLAGWLTPVLEATESDVSSVQTEHFSHGDLTPWNCLVDGDRLTLVDWEMAAFRLPAWDLVHYVFQVESLARQQPVDRSAASALQQLRTDEVTSVALQVAEVDPAQPDVWPRLQQLILIDQVLDLAIRQAELSRRGIAIRVSALARLTDVAPLDAEVLS
jgi:thiamine kinase-like enzyme